MNSNNYNLEELKSIIEILREVEAKSKDGESDEEIEGFFIDKIKPFIRDEKLLEEMERLNIEEYYEQDIYIEIFESLSSNMSSKGLYFFIRNVSLEFINEVYTKENVERINQALPEKKVSHEIFKKVMQSKEIDEDSRWGYYVPVIFENSSKRDKEKFKEAIIYYIDLFKDKISDPNAISILTKMLKDNDIEEITPNEFMSLSNFILDVDISNMIQSNLMNLLDIVIEKLSKEAIEVGFDTFTEDLVSNLSIPNDIFSLDIKSNTLCKLLEKEKELGILNKEHVDKVIDILTIPDKDAPHITPDGIKRLWNCLDDDLKLQEYEHIVENVNSMEVEYGYEYCNIAIDLWELSSSELQEHEFDYVINYTDNLKLSKKYKNKELMLQEFWKKTNDDVKKQNPQILIKIMFEISKYYSVKREFIEDIMQNINIYSKEFSQEIALRLLDFESILQNSGKSFEEFLIEQLNDSETPLFDNTFVSGIAQKIDKGLLSDTISESLKKRIISERERIDTSNVDLEKYSDKINNFQNMSEEEFSQFSIDIKLLKMKNGRIPEKYCDYIILQAIRKNSTLNKDFEKNQSLLKRAFEDKSTYITEAKGLNPIEFRFCKLEDETTGAAISFSNETKLITYETEKIYQPIDIIKTMYHEIQHACQNKDINSGKLTDKNQYRMIKEKILREIDQNYYNKNYDNLYSEIDARLQALIQTKECLQYLGLTKEEIEEIKFDMYDGYGFQKAMENEERDLKQADDKIFKNKLQKLDKIFEKEIVNNPKYLELFPILKREFKSDGTKKTEEEMKKKMEDEIAGNPENRNQILFEYSVIMDRSLDELTSKASIERSIFASIDGSVSADQRSEATNFIETKKIQEEPSIPKANGLRDLIPEEPE